MARLQLGRRASTASYSRCGRMPTGRSCLSTTRGRNTAGCAI